MDKNFGLQLEQSPNYLNLKTNSEVALDRSFDGKSFSVSSLEVKDFRKINNDPYGQEHDADIVPQVLLLNTWASVYGSYSFFEQMMKEEYDPKKYEIKALNLSIEQTKPVPVNTPVFNRMTLVAVKPNDARKGVKLEIKYEVVLPDESVAASGSRTILINAS
ncbi:MAG TPA: hypothetical protein VJB09_00235 [Candidatus Paceibacterota bacterium]